MSPFHHTYGPTTIFWLVQGTWMCHHFMTSHSSSSPPPLVDSPVHLAGTKELIVGPRTSEDKSAQKLVHGPRCTACHEV